VYTLGKSMRLLTFMLLPILIAALYSFSPKPVESLPPVILWAWERPERLDFIDTEKVGVAYLAKTITLRGDRVVVRPRLQPLQLPEDTKLIAVVRIESDREDRPTLTTGQIEQTAREVVNVSAKSPIQIDFDATLSERQFYRELIRKVRDDLPASIPLSITALASWCAGDDWISDLPVDEAVPMLFRLGVEERNFQRRLESGEGFESRICRNSAGVSTDEPVKAPAVDRLYIFSPTPWSEQSFRHAMEAYSK
jgi:hypothetical protein